MCRQTQAYIGVYAFRSRSATLDPGYPVAPSNGRAAQESMPACCAGLDGPCATWGSRAGRLVRRLCGRESIFLFSHTNEFCGNSKVAPEAGVAWARLKDGRRVCERGQMRKRLPACCGTCKRVLQRAQRLCRSAGWPAHPGNRAVKISSAPVATTVPYLAETFCGAPSAACRPQRHRCRRVPSSFRPPRSRRPSGRTAYWGCPKAAGGLIPSLRRRMGSVGDWPLASPTT